jgi:hypothetical protein
LKEVQESSRYEDCQHNFENLCFKYRRKRSRRAPGNNYHCLPGIELKKKHITWHVQDDVTIFYSPKKMTQHYFMQGQKVSMYLESQYKEGPHTIKTSE